MDTKSSLSERDIITKCILPAIEQSGWNKQIQIREEVTFTVGRIFVKGKKTKRGEKKRAIIEELENQGIIFEELKDEIKNDLDIFDLICHIAWDAPALTRKERAENVRKRNYWTKYGDKARAVLNAILDKYAQTGIEEIEDMKVLTVDPIKHIGTPAEIVKLFGGKPQYLQAIRELEAEIYKVA